MGRPRNEAMSRSLDSLAGSRRQRALARSGSPGVVSVTVGLSSVGPPPTSRMSQLLASFMTTGLRPSTRLRPEHRLIELPGPVLVGDPPDHLTMTTIPPAHCHSPITGAWRGCGPYSMASPAAARSGLSWPSSSGATFSARSPTSTASAGKSTSARQAPDSTRSAGCRAGRTGLTGPMQLRLNSTRSHALAPAARLCTMR
jgi:hypothetical protein